METLLQITMKDDVPCIDTVQIAEKLELAHPSLIKTIEKYLEHIQREFGHPRFEIRTVTNSVGAQNQQRIAYLSEDQALFVATLSRNSDQVVAFKILLIKSYQALRAKLTQVKQVVQPAIEKLQNRIKYLEAKLDSNERLHKQELRQLGFKLENNQSQLEFYRKNSDMLHEHWREAEERYFKENDIVMSMLEELVSLRRQVKALPAAQASVPELPTTTKVRMMVDDHCKKTGSHQEAIWNELYLLMYYHHGISVNRWTRPKGVSKLQEIERRGYAEKLLALAVQHFAESQVAA